jgi:putative ABC transport system permease protein
MGIPLLQGRVCSESDVFEGPRIAVVNQAMAVRYFANENPVGKRLTMGGRTPNRPAAADLGADSPWIEIVGVVANTRSLGQGAERAPTVYVSY